MRIRNTHARSIGASADLAGSLLDTYGSVDDRFWRTGLAEPVTFVDGLRVGSLGGHGNLRYRISGYEPGLFVEAEFEPGGGLRGRHRFVVIADGSERCTVQHTLDATAHGVALLVWPLGLRAIHDAVIEAVFDNVELSLTGEAHPTLTPSRWTLFLARHTLTRYVAPCDESPSPLLRSTIGRVDAADCFSTPLLPGDSRRPEDWARQLLGRPNRLLRLRDALVRPLGLKSTADHGRPITGFPVVADSDDEIVLGVDDRHLDFRVALTTGHGQLHMTTVVQVHNTTGKLYWSVVRHLHPRVVRRLMARSPLPTSDDRSHPNEPEQPRES